MESFISYLTFSAAPTTAHVRTDLSHNSQEGLLTSSAEQVQRLRSTTQPLALDPPRKLSTKLDATTRNRYERNRYDEDLVQWAPLWANGLLARLSPSQLAHLRSISGDPKPSSEVIRGHQAIQSPHRTRRGEAPPWAPPLALARKPGEPGSFTPRSFTSLDSVKTGGAGLSDGAPRSSRSERSLLVISS